MLGVNFDLELQCTMNCSRWATRRPESVYRLFLSNIFWLDLLPRVLRRRIYIGPEQERRFAEPELCIISRWVGVLLVFWRAILSHDVVTMPWYRVHRNLAVRSSHALNLDISSFEE